MSIQNPDSNVTIVIPVFNEEQAIQSVISELHRRYAQFEIVVVDDGSTDRTAEIVSQLPCRLIAHKTNRGYGAALKTGILHAKRDAVLFYDGDGQFDPADVERLVERMKATGADCVLGLRDHRSYSPLSRKLGKFVYRKVASFLARHPLPDPNCGLRILRRQILLDSLSLLPDSFSASTTSTLLMMKRGYMVEFLPVVVQKRVGSSSMRQIRDGSRSLLVLVRLVALFDPLRIFLPPAGILIVLSLIYSTYEAVTQGLGVPVLGAAMFLAGLLFFFLGIICDQVSALRLGQVSPISPTHD